MDLKTLSVAGIMGITGIVGTSIVLGGTADKTQRILDENVELHTRLNEPAVLDLSIITSKEISQAYINIAEKYGVTAGDIINAGNNIQEAIKVKMVQQSLLCL